MTCSTTALAATSGRRRKRISELFGEEEVLIEGEVLRASLRRGRGRLQILTAQVSDGSGQISATWFNQPWLKDKLLPGRASGCGASRTGGFAVRSFDLDGGTATADFAPVYPASEEVSAAKLRELVTAALAHARDHPDALPVRVKSERGLPLRADALVAVHQPRSLDEAEAGGSGSPSTSCSCSARSRPPSRRAGAPGRGRAARARELIDRYRAFSRSS